MDDPSEQETCSPEAQLARRETLRSWLAVLGVEAGLTPTHWGIFAAQPQLLGLATDAQAYDEAVLELWLRLGAAHGAHETRRPTLHAYRVAFGRLCATDPNAWPITRRWLAAKPAQQQLALLAGVGLYVIEGPDGGG